MGKLTTITGPMFSGKTTELLRIYKREEIAQRKSLLFKPKLDTRYSENNVVNHDGQKIPAIIAEKPEDIYQSVIDYLESEDQKTKPLKSVFIDEIQFFDSSIIHVIKQILDKEINIYTSGLNQTSEGDPFPFKDNKNNIGFLMAISDFVTHLDAVCNICGEVATKTYRQGNQRETVIIGGFDLYQARCTKCFRKKQ
jgi:thymidine kinase